MAKTRFEKPGSRRLKRERKIIDMAQNKYVRSDGNIEIDIDAKLSEGDDNGCYVAAWVWVDFANTEFDKDKEIIP